ncbi:MAG TPA: NADPH:quinone oxidoreductase family protein [Terriglobales bacterium]|nr:NADPH:quinone oxidoreductase family protein [Terriglobales bacterium]
MKAVVVPRRGGPDVLELREVPEPALRDDKNEVLLEVEAIGVNFADTVQTQGMYPSGPRPPYIPGLEFAGKIVGATGDQRYMGFTHSGAYAQRLSVRKDSLLPVPHGWTAAEAASFPVNYFTVYFAYWMAQLVGEGVASPSGKRVLIQAAAGGVGTAAVEIGKLLGLEMFGTSSSDEKLRKVKELGLQHGINYRTQDYETVIAEATKGRGVHAVLEMLGGEHTAKGTRCLGDMGHIIIYGLATGQSPQFDFMAMFQKNLSAHALWLTPLTAHPELMRAAWKQLSQWVGEGKLRPVVGTELPLERAAEAHRMLLERRNYGKVVLTV